MASRAGPFDPDVPVAGHYKTRFVKDGPPVALYLYHGFPVDPLTGEAMDRAPRWLAVINGQEIVDAFRFWPGCARDPIGFAEHLHICERSRTMDPSDPYFDPMKPVDWSTAKPPF